MNFSGKITRFSQKYFRVFGGAVFILTAGLFARRGHGRLAAAAEFFGWRNPEKSYPIHFPDITIAELFPQEIKVSLYDPEGQDGNVSPLELVVINAWVKQLKPQTVFEFGTFDGRTTRNIAMNTESGVRIYTLDLPDEKISEAKTNPFGDVKFAGKVPTGYKYKKTPYEENITEIRYDSAVFDPTPYKHTMDFIFVDGAHSLSYVRNDTKNALQMLRTDGVILWHDCRSSCAGVTEALNRLYVEGGIGKNLRHIRGTALTVLLPEHFL